MSPLATVCPATSRRAAAGRPKAHVAAGRPETDSNGIVVWKLIVGGAVAIAAGDEETIDHSTGVDVVAVDDVIAVVAVHPAGVVTVEIA